jgi:Fic family protein
MQAREELARLDGVGRHLPNPQILLTPMQNREAQRSSSIEGTYATPQQLAMFEMSPTGTTLEVQELQAALEVSNYASALRFRKTDPEDLPLSLRLIRNLHRILMEGVRGKEKNPGEFRRGQVQVGSNARYVPPPANELDSCLDNLEKYMHQEKMFDPLVETFIVHYQFEAIHPFTDGNGRVGRLLLAILIQEWCGLAEQWLYMSDYFDKHKDEYIEDLLRISTTGDWNSWIGFCLRGVVEQALDTQKRCEQLLSLREEYRKRLNSIRHTGRLNSIVENLFIQPVATSATIIKAYGVTYATARSDLESLAALDILTEVQLRQRRQKGYYCSDILQVTYGT